VGGVISNGGLTIASTSATRILTLTNNAATYTGATTVNGGVLALTNGASLSSSTALNLAATTTNASFDVSGITASGTAIGSLAGASNSSVVLGAKNLTNGGDSTTTTFAGVASGIGGSLTKAGNGTLTLSGVNTYDGDTYVNAGTVKLSGSGAIAAGSGVVVSSGATFDFNSLSRTVDGISGAGAVTLGSATLTVSNSATNNFSGTLSGSGGLVKVGAGTQFLSGANSYSGGTLVSAGTLSGDTTSLQGNITNNAATIFSQTTNGSYAATMSGSGALTKSGAGTLILSTSNSYTGGTSINGGTLKLANQNAAGTGSVVQTTMASLVEFLSTGRMTSAMTVFQYSFADSFEAAGQVTLADAASSIAVASGKTVAGSGQFVGSGGLTKRGLGALTLSASNNFSGPISVEEGTLELASVTSSAAGSASSVTVANGATLLLSQNDQVNNSASVTLSGGTITRASGVSETFGSLNLTASSFIDFGSGTEGNLTFGTYTPSDLLTVNNFFGGNTLIFGSNLTGSIAVGTYDTTSYTSADGLFTINSISGGFTTSYSGGNFTITAIPETSTVVAAIGLVGLCLWPLRRRVWSAARRV